MPLPSVISRKEWIIALLVFAPVLFINVSASHDWGDDFAQYILQAKCIAEGKPQTTYAIYDEQYYNVLGPPTRPVGLPLLLSPVYYFFGNNMLAFSCLVSACYYLIALLVFRYMRGWISFIPSLLWTCTMIYNPKYLELKLAVLSDFPFIILLFLFFNLVKKVPSTKQIILLGLLAGGMICFRLIGIVMLPVYCCYWLFNKSYSKNFRSFLKQPLLFCAVALGLFILLNSFLLHNTNESWKAYSFIEGMIDYPRLLYTIHYYTFIYTLIYEQEIWAFGNLIQKSFMLAIVIIGFIISINKKRKAEDWFVIIYLGTMLFYPSCSAAIRFLMPVFPMLLYYQTEAINSIQFPSNKLNKLKIYAIPLILLLSYKINLQNTLHQQGAVLEGPQEKYSAEAFEYVTTHLPKNVTYAFSQRHAFTLYTDRKCIPYHRFQTAEEMNVLFERYHIKYLLYIDKVNDPKVLDIVDATHTPYQLIWKNARCKIFEHL